MVLSSVGTCSVPTKALLRTRLLLNESQGEHELQVMACTLPHFSRQSYGLLSFTWSKTPSRVALKHQGGRELMCRLSHCFHHNCVAKVGTGYSRAFFSGTRPSKMKPVLSLGRAKTTVMGAQVVVLQVAIE